MYIHYKYSYMHVILLKTIYWVSSHQNLSIRFISILSFSYLPSFTYHFHQYYSEGYLNYFNDKIYKAKLWNAIAQKLQHIFTWNKKQMKAKKYSLLLIFFFRIIKAIKMPKFTLITQISSKFCYFLEFS